MFWFRTKAPSVWFALSQRRPKRGYGEKSAIDGYQPFLPAVVVVERRFLADIVNGMRADGLTVAYTLAPGGPTT